MQKNLVIVESPAKAKTLEKFLGKDYKVMSSYGHIRDLKKKEMSVNLDTFSPEYEIPTDKEAVVKELDDVVMSSPDLPIILANRMSEGGTFVRKLFSNLLLFPRSSPPIVRRESLGLSFFRGFSRTSFSSCLASSSWPPS